MFSKSVVLSVSSAARDCFIDWHIISQGNAHENGQFTVLYSKNDVTKTEI